jgi:hypothetical protein
LLAPRVLRAEPKIRPPRVGMAGHCPERDTTVTNEENEEIVYDWKDLVAALREVIDGALNAAAKASSYEEEWDAIANVREFVYDWLDGHRANVKLTDLLLVLGIILSAIEIDLGIDSSELLEPLRTLIDLPTYRPAVIRCPGADSLEKPTVVIRHVARRRRNAAFASPLTAFAA